MTRRPPEWLEQSTPWNAPVAAAQCAGLPVSPNDIPVVELPSAPLPAAELIALRNGRFIPWFGRGPTRDEAVRLMANVARALGASHDLRGTEHALAMSVHPALEKRPLRAVIEAAASDTDALACARAALSALGLLGASDTQRETVARELVAIAQLAGEATVTWGAGGGDLGKFREHYAVLVSAGANDGPAVRVVRGFFDFVLARRFAGLDALHMLHDLAANDPASRWLLAVADLVAGDERARIRMTETAQSVLAPLSALLPRLMTLAAREMNELVGHPLRVRAQHLRCAASRDHAAAAIRAWLSAAAESHDDDDAPLGPEPSRAGRSAISARDRAGEFLLDWFVPDRDARKAVDHFARMALRFYHRLRGAQLFAALLADLAPTTAPSSRYERMLWGSP